MKKLPKLPKLLDRKVYKTGQTRGADDDVIYQNRVSRTSTVLIPYSVWERASAPPKGKSTFEFGSITLIMAGEYFGTPRIEAELARRELVLGQNALVLYETREQWHTNNPDSRGWNVAKSRLAPLGGEYVARIPAITAEDGERIIRGFSTTSNKGAGIRSYEYASTKTNQLCRLQLEALFWLCEDSVAVVRANGMSAEDADSRRSSNLESCRAAGLLDEKRLIKARIIDAKSRTVCPLCLDRLLSAGFFNRLEQAEGREVLDLTVTELNLFHVEELRYGLFNHRPYNVGWGHHHCNVVAKDSGILKTLDWMETVLRRNVELGYFASKARGN